MDHDTRHREPTTHELSGQRSSMSRFTHAAGAAARDRTGQTLIEYQLLIGLIAVVCIASITLFGGQVVDLFNVILGAL
jgi:Flp pilus assembly pilin Flp